jgi:hypothetical protein
VVPTSPAIKLDLPELGLTLDAPAGARACTRACHAPGKCECEFNLLTYESVFQLL